MTVKPRDLWPPARPARRRPGSASAGLGILITGLTATPPSTAFPRTVLAVPRTRLSSAYVLMALPADHTTSAGQAAAPCVLTHRASGDTDSARAVTHSPATSECRRCRTG